MRPWLNFWEYWKEIYTPNSNGGFDVKKKAGRLVPEHIVYDD
jgi:hypothetical protein